MSILLVYHEYIVVYYDISLVSYSLVGPPPPCNSGIIRIWEGPNIVTSTAYSHYYRVGGPPKPQDNPNITPI